MTTLAQDLCATIDHFDVRYENVGGITRPKRLRCVGSDGRTYLQLLKGGDDMRQDAVMQQVFSFVNQVRAVQCAGPLLTVSPSAAAP